MEKNFLGITDLNTVSACIQPHSTSAFSKVLFLGVFLNRTPFFGQKVPFLRNFFNWTSPKNQYWKIEPRGCKRTDTVHSIKCYTSNSKRSSRLLINILNSDSWHTTAKGRICIFFSIQTDTKIDMMMINLKVSPLRSLK